MIKKLLTLLFIGVLSVGAFAGAINPYIEIENVGTDFEPRCTIGAEVSDVIGTSDWPFTANGSYYDAELLNLRSNRQLDFGVSIGSNNYVDLLDGNKIVHGVTFFVDETLIFKNVSTIVIDLFEPSFGVKAFFGPITAWVEAAFPYTNHSDWGFNPTVGFSIGK